MDRTATIMVTWVMLAASSAGAVAAAPLETEMFRETGITVPHASARPIGAIDFSHQAVEGRRLGPWIHDAHRFSGDAATIFYEDGGVRGTEHQVHYDKWGRRCTTSGNLTMCKDRAAPVSR